ncbi:MAG TPA: ASCH domain-containing protein [Methylomirabilota bacterium]|nr:ASCH domain-containing protein [Methylomirabilota bacterium]
MFPRTEGEGDRSLVSWRKAHWAYFGRVCERLGRQRSARMPVVCERFRVVLSS